MSTGAKVAIAAVVIIFVGGAVAAAGMFYAAHRVSQKFHEAISDQLDPSPSGGKKTGTVATVNPCSYLSKEDVSAAIGVEIVKAQAEDTACNFYAKGSQADMSAKHMAAMVASKGADQKTQQMIQGISGGMFKTFQSESKEPQDKSGEVIVFNYSIDDNAAAEQMKLNRTGLGSIGGKTVQDLAGIGDQAFDTADSAMTILKGNKLIRIMYMTCPCNTDAVKPLAKKLADAL